MYYVWMEGKRKTVREKERRKIKVVLLLFQGQSKICMFTVVTMLGKSKMFGNEETHWEKICLILQETQLTILLFALIQYLGCAL